MKSIKIDFVDFGADFKLKCGFLKAILDKYYLVEISSSPDYLFYSCNGYEHCKFKYRNCVKIFFTGENIVPDFNICDYGMAFHQMSLGDRYLRFPLFLLYAWDDLEKMQNDKIIDKKLADRKFCNFVYSNFKVANPIREHFFRELSKYKKIDSGGKYLNNIGYFVGNKLDFISQYKFTIAMENSSVPGYTTEKLIQPMIVNSMPIYWGNPNVSVDFNVKSFININDFASISDVIDYIIYLDTHDDEYLKKISQNWFSVPNIKMAYEELIKNFFDNIFNAPLEEVHRISEYGWAKRYRREYRRMMPYANRYIVRKLCGLFEKLKGEYY